MSVLWFFFWFQCIEALLKVSLYTVKCPLHWTATVTTAVHWQGFICRTDEIRPCTNTRRAPSAKDTSGIQIQWDRSFHCIFHTVHKHKKGLTMNHGNNLHIRNTTEYSKNFNIIYFFYYFTSWTFILHGDPVANSLVCKKLVNTSNKK